MQYQPEDAEYENVRAALMWAREAEEFELLLRLASAISPYWYARFNLSEGTGWLEDALARGSSQPAPIRARALAALAQLAWPRGDIERVRSSAEEARTIFAAEGDRDRLAHAVHLLSIAAELEGRYDDERRLQGEAEALFRVAENVQGLSAVLNNRGYLEIISGSYEAAELLLLESIDLNPANAAQVRLNLGLALLELRRLDEARSEFARSLGEGVASDAPELVLYALEGLAGIAASSGNDEAAAGLWGASEGLRASIDVVLAIAERDLHDRLLPESRARLGADRFARAWAEGRRCRPSAPSSSRSRPPSSYTLIRRASPWPPPEQIAARPSPPVGCANSVSESRVRGF